MTMMYTPRDASYMKRVREYAEPNVDLVHCSDGLWRTPDEKASFDRERAFPKDRGIGSVS